MRIFGSNETKLSEDELKEIIKDGILLKMVMTHFSLFDVLIGKATISDVDIDSLRMLFE